MNVVVRLLELDNALQRGLDSYRLSNILQEISPPNIQMNT